MRKLIILILTSVSITTLGSCDDFLTKSSDLLNHLNTMKALDTYVIEVESTKHRFSDDIIDTNYVYVDNYHDTFLVSEEEKTEVSVSCDDILFEVDEDELYGYICGDIWTRYAVSKDYMGIRDVEVNVYTFLKDATETSEDGIITYTGEATIAELRGKIYNFIGEDFSVSEENIVFPMRAYYSEEEDRFLSFELDLTPIYNKGTTLTEEEPNWIVSMSFVDLDRDFELYIEDRYTDDYVSDYLDMDILTYHEINSYDMVKGGIDYIFDIDIMKITFDHEGFYQIHLCELDNLSHISVTLLDETMNMIRELTINEVGEIYDYWEYDEGTYYLLVTGEVLEEAPSEYNFLFISK